MIMGLSLTAEEQLAFEEQMAVWEQQHIDALFSDWDMEYLLNKNGVA